MDTLPSYTVCLFPTRAQCKQLNVAMLDRINSERIVLTADDEIEAKTLQQKEKKFAAKTSPKRQDYTHSWS